MEKLFFDDFFFNLLDNTVPFDNWMFTLSEILRFPSYAISLSDITEGAAHYTDRDIYI